MTRVKSVCLVAAAVLLSGSRLSPAVSPRAFDLLRATMAAAPDAPHGEVLYLKHCTHCHSPRAWGKGPAAVPSLAGQREYYLIEQLIQVSTLERNVPEMHRVLTAPDLDRPQAVRDLAAYLAHAPRDPHSEQGSGRDLSKGEQVYKRQCAMCHGKNGEGSEDEPIPAVGGQHYDYLLTQLRGFAAGHRGTVEPPVLDFTAGLSSRELAAVADYMSRLSPLPSEEKAPRK